MNIKILTALLESINQQTNRHGKSINIKITTHKANTADWHSYAVTDLKPCSPYIKTKCYLGTVRPIIEYACTVWAPHTAQAINNVEMIQRRAARLICIYVP